MAGTAFRDGQRWRGHVQVNGVRKYVRGRTKTEVKKRLDILAGEPGQNPDNDLGGKTPTSVAEFSREWLLRLQRRVTIGDLREQTATKYADWIRLYILPTLGDIQMADLAESDVTRMRDANLAKGLARDTAAGAMRLFGTMCKAAISQGLLKHNPVPGVRKPSSTVRPAALSKTEAERLLAVAEGLSMGPARVACSCVLGMRQGEILALTVDDVTWADGLPTSLIVRRTLSRNMWKHGPACQTSDSHTASRCQYRVRAQLTGDPKTENGFRAVPIPSLWRQVFKDQATAAADLAEQQGSGRRWLFPGPRGGRPREDTDAHAWARMVRRVLGPDAPTGTHAGRRRAATALAEAGVPLYVAKKLLGWGSGELMNIYARVSDDVVRSEMERVYSDQTACGLPVTRAATSHTFSPYTPPT